MNMVKITPENKVIIHFKNLLPSSNISNNYKNTYDLRLERLFGPHYIACLRAVSTNLIKVQ